MNKRYNHARGIQQTTSQAFRDDFPGNSLSAFWLAPVLTGAAGVRNYVTGLQLKGTNAVATEVVVKDGSTVIWRGHLSASMTRMDVITFSTPLRGTAATALNFACITPDASVYVNAQGYKAT